MSKKAELYEEIKNKTQISNSALDVLIEKKIESLSGLIDREGAIRLIALEKEVIEPEYKSSSLEYDEEIAKKLRDLQITFMEAFDKTDINIKEKGKFYCKLKNKFIVDGQYGPFNMYRVAVIEPNEPERVKQSCFPAFHKSLKTQLKNQNINEGSVFYLETKGMQEHNDVQFYGYYVKKIFNRTAQSSLK